jgi:hypothetical protein
VPFLSLAIGEPAHGQQIRTVEQPDAVVERQPFAGGELVSDVAEAEAMEALMHSVNF